MAGRAGGKGVQPEGWKERTRRRPFGFCFKYTVRQKRERIYDDTDATANGNRDSSVI